MWKLCGCILLPSGLRIRNAADGSSTCGRLFCSERRWSCIVWYQRQKACHPRGIWIADGTERTVSGGSASLRMLFYHRDYRRSNSLRGKNCVVLAAAVILTCICCIGYQNVLYVPQGKKASSTNNVRVALNVSELVANFYCYPCLWQYEKRFVVMLCRIRCGGFTQRKWISIGLSLTGVLLHATSKSLTIIHHHSTAIALTRIVDVFSHFCTSKNYLVTISSALSCVHMKLWWWYCFFFIESVGQRANCTANLDLPKIGRLLSLSRRGSG